MLRVFYRIRMDRSVCVDAGRVTRLGALVRTYVVLHLLFHTVACIDCSHWQSNLRGTRAEGSFLFLWSDSTPFAHIILYICICTQLFYNSDWAADPEWRTRVESAGLDLHQLLTSLHVTPFIIHITACISFNIYGAVCKDQERGTLWSLLVWSYTIW